MNETKKKTKKLKVNNSKLFSKSKTLKQGGILKQFTLIVSRKIYPEGLPRKDMSF